MFERFRREARAVVIRAQQEARDLRDEVIDVDHLFLAMLSEADSVAGRALDALALDRAAMREDLLAARPTGPFDIDKGDAEALRAIGIDVSEIQQRLEQELGPDLVAAGTALAPPRRRRWFRWWRHEDAAAPRRHIPFSPQAKKVLELSLRQAIALKHMHIDSGHMLLALLTSIVCRPHDVLTAQGVSVEAARTAVRGVQCQAS